MILAMKHKNKGLKCKVEGCDRPACRLGYCSLHYLRFHKHGDPTIVKSVKGSKWDLDDPRYKNKTQICSMEGCNKFFWAKGFCRNHYDMWLRRGTTVYARDMPFHLCKVDGCEEKAGRLGYCRFHRERKHNGTDLLRPKGVAGELNYNWKGGVAEYPNHSEMKRVRKQVLEEANWICHFCGGPAREVHHKDGSKDNHSKDNLVACCRKCNAGQRGGCTTSKYIRIYGKTIKNLAKERGISERKAYLMFRVEKELRSLPEEVTAVLF